MNKMIACCGINCETCEARLATINDDDQLRKEVSRKWCEMNHTDQITPETINCTGCRTDGMKFYFCNHLCEIRKCVTSKGYETCGDCPEKSNCLMPLRGKSSTSVSASQRLNFKKGTMHIAETSLFLL